VSFINILIGSIIFSIWILAFSLVFKQPVDKKNSTKVNIYNYLGYDKIVDEAQEYGIKLSKKEILNISMLSVVAVIVIILLTGNIYFIIVALVLSYYIPRYFLIRTKKAKRKKILFELPNNLKILVSYLLDSQSLLVAIKRAMPEIEGESKIYFEKLEKSLNINLEVDKTLQEFANDIKLRKLTDFAEKLSMMHTEGVTPQGIQSLKDNIKQIQKDIQNIKILEMKSKKEKKNTLLIIVACWFIPIALSFLSTDNSNIFLDTFVGQVLIVSFFAATIITIVKGDEYLSLNLDEL
jgi:Flp pilus assembly protein TadB